MHASSLSGGSQGVGALGVREAARRFATARWGRSYRSRPPLSRVFSAGLAAPRGRVKFRGPRVKLEDCCFEFHARASCLANSYLGGDRLGLELLGLIVSDERVDYLVERAVHD